LLGPGLTACFRLWRGIILFLDVLNQHTHRDTNMKISALARSLFKYRWQTLNDTKTGQTGHTSTAMGQ
jgi:hypothetical protein